MYSLSMQVYINPSNVDDYLVESITRPAEDPNAGEVYYRYMIMSNLVSVCLMVCLVRVKCEGVKWGGSKFFKFFSQ